MLILVGIAIAQLTGGGILEKTKLAKQKYEISETKEKLELKITELRIEEEGKGDTLTKEDLPKLNNDEIDVGSIENFPVEVICGKYKFNVDENFVVTYVGEANQTVVTYTTEPEGYTNQDDIQITIKVSNQKGIKEIEYPDGEKLKVGGEKEIGIDYPVTANGTYTFKIIDIENNEVTKDVVIDQIDKLDPLDFTPEVTPKGTDIIIKENGEDADSDGISTKSGIGNYEYYLKMVGETEYTKYETNTITGLNGETEYMIYVIAYDKAGNNKQSQTVTATTGEAWSDVYQTTGDYTDAYGNVAKIPEGFQVSTKTGQKNINEGLVVRNATDKNEFVWIPVGKIYTDTARTEENAKTIGLNRYTFDSSTGLETAQNDNVINTWCQELATSAKGNTTAKAIETFKTSATTNKGFYIGRYEARTATERSAKTDPITTITEKGIDYVYNYVTQIQAADLAQNMYDSTKPFTSDLMNSYAWDTATLFLQTFGTNSNYSNQPSLNGSRAATGTNDTTKYTGTQDVQCNVYDMASNVWEWTTETSSYNSPSRPCVFRGGDYANTSNTSYRNFYSTSISTGLGGFRPLLYL